MKVYNVPNDLEHAFLVHKVPYLEGYTGYAVVTVGDIAVSSDLDADVKAILDGAAMVFNPAQTVFLLDCEHKLFRQVYKGGTLSDKSLQNHFPVRDGGHRRLDESLEIYFIGDLAPTPKPEPVVEPDPQPDPQEVAKEWYPMDELPDNGE